MPTSGYAPPRRSKYGAKRTTVDGITFHSAKEARRYGELQLLQKAGQIWDLERQPRYPLVVAGVTIGAYVGDFRYRERRDLVRHGDQQAEFLVVEDVKGVRTPLYTWKAQHVLAQYGVQIREV